MSFSIDIDDFIADTEKKAEKIVRGTALGLFANIIKLTPVGNPDKWKTKYPPKSYVGGRLRGNWQVNLHRLPVGNVPTTDKSGSKTISRGMKDINRAKSGDTIYLANNLPYAQEVENGSSTQAPDGMVRRTVAKFHQVVKKQVDKHK